MVDERLERLLRYANLPHAEQPRTFDSFTPRRGTEDALREAWSYVNGATGYRVLVLIGQMGSGKSHLLEAICRYWIGAGRPAKYQHVPKLLDELREAYDSKSDMSFLDVFERYQAAEMLALDDLGTENATPWVVEKLTTLVDERYRNGCWLVVGTNLLREEVAEHYHERLASRLWDRNTGMVRQVTLTATDYRLRP